MKWFVTCFIGLSIFLLFLHHGVGIKCFVCNSYITSTCSDPFDNSTYKLQQCEDGVTMCRKIVQHVYYEDRWNIRYIRQCAPTGIVGKFDGRVCLEKTGTHRVKLAYCHCDNRNGCNDASDVTGSKFMVMMSTFGVMLTIVV